MEGQVTDLTKLLNTKTYALFPNDSAPTRKTICFNKL